jgi:ABC-type branched-subunit amino acid transport system ATPase component
MSAYFAAEGVRKRIGGTPVLDAVTLAVGAGEAVGLFGPNGSGKTTLVNVLSGLVAPDAGVVRFEGRDITRFPMDARYRMGIARTFQIPHPYPALTVREAVEVARCAPRRRDTAAARAAPDDGPAVDELLARCGLSGQRHVPCARLSQGCLRRMEFARALARHPRLLVLDELFSGLSATDEDELAALLRAVNREDGVAFLLVSHNPPLLRELCGRIAVIEGGRIVRDRAVRQ